MNERFEAYEPESFQDKQDMRELSSDEIEYVAGGKDRLINDEGRQTGWDVRFLNWLLRRR